MKVVKLAGFTLIAAVDIQHSTSRGRQCQTYGRLLVTIAIAAIDVQHCKSIVQQGQRYGRQTVGQIAAIDFQNCTSTDLHESLFQLYSYSELYTETRYSGI